MDASKHMTNYSTRDQLREQWNSNHCKLCGNLLTSLWECYQCDIEPLFSEEFHIRTYGSSLGG